MLGSSRTQVAGVHARRFGQAVAVGALVCAMAASRGVRRDDRGRALQSLSQQSRHQSAARRRARRGRRHAGGQGRVSAAVQRDGERGLRQRDHYSSRGRATLAHAPDAVQLRRDDHPEHLERQSDREFGVAGGIRRCWRLASCCAYTEQQVLLQALTDYMDVLRDTAILDLNKNNVEVLQEQLRQTKDRFNVGEVTRTDVAQAEASLAGAQAQELTAQSTLQASMASYRQAIGDEPKSLAPVSPISKPLPRTVLEAVAISQVEHPQSSRRCTASTSRSSTSRSAKASCCRPSTSRARRQQLRPAGISPAPGTVEASVMGQITIPIYQGGGEYAGIRAAKEQLGQQELSTDLARDQVRAAVVAAWGTNQNSTGIVRGREGAGRCGGSCARRRARGGQGRPAHHARRAERAADPAQRARAARDARSTTRSWIPTRCFRRSAACRSSRSGWRWRNTIRGCISIR